MKTWYYRPTASSTLLAARMRASGDHGPHLRGSVRLEMLGSCHRPPRGLRPPGASSIPAPSPACTSTPPGPPRPCPTTLTPAVAASPPPRPRPRQAAPASPAPAPARPRPCCRPAPLRPFATFAKGISRCESLSDPLLGSPRPTPAVAASPPPPPLPPPPPPLGQHHLPPALTWPSRPRK